MWTARDRVGNVVPRFTRKCLASPPLGFKKIRLGDRWVSFGVPTRTPLGEEMCDTRRTSTFQSYSVFATKSLIETHCSVLRQRSADRR